MKRIRNASRSQRARWRKRPMRACRAVCFRPGVRHEADDIAEATQPQAVLQILAGADVQAALPQECIAPIHGTGAGQTGDRVHDVEDGSPCTDRHQVLDALKSGPYRLALVADRNIATRAGDARIAECGREPRDRGRLENRVGIHGQKQIAAGKPGRGVDCRAAAATRAVADDHVHQAQRASPLRDSARFVGRAVIDDNDFDRPQGLPVQRRDRGVEPGAAVERRYDHADRSVAGRHSVASSAHAEQGQRNQRQRIARNVEYQHREGEQEQVGSGEQLHHFEHVTHLGGQLPKANVRMLQKFRGHRLKPDCCHPNTLNIN